MYSVAALKADLRDITEKANRIVKDKSLPAAEVTRRIDALEVEAKDIHAKLKEAEAGPNPALMSMGAPGESYLGGRVVQLGGPQLGTAGIVDLGPKSDPPPLQMTLRQATELYEAATSRRPHSIELGAKNLIDTGDGEMFTLPEHVLPPLPFQREGMRVMDLMPVYTTTSGSVKYYKITTPAAAASTVAEGGPKPESSIAWSTVDAPIKKIAHLATVTDEVLDDMALALQVISDELLGGLLQEENHQLLRGSGTGNDLEGILTNVDILDRPVAGDTKLDAVAKAMTDVRVGAAFLDPDGIVLNPNDFTDLLLAKDDAHRYLATDPISGNPRQLWGMRVALTTAMPEGSALIGAFATGAIAIVRMGPRVDVNRWSETEYKSNKTLLRAEQRLGLAVIRPTNFCLLTGL